LQAVEPIVEKNSEPIVEKISEAIVEKISEPPPVTENISELPSHGSHDHNHGHAEQHNIHSHSYHHHADHHHHHLEDKLPAAQEVKPSEVPEIQTQSETIPSTVETTEAPIEPPITTEKHEIVQETLPPSQKQFLKPDPDALLQRFNEKLGNRIVEGTGKGTVEPLHKPDEHHHHHGVNDHHEHHSHGHDHHHHEEKISEVPEEKSPEVLNAEEEEDKPGFFGGLLKKFFSDEDDSEQHFHDKAQVDNILNPTTQHKGEFYSNLMLAHFQL
jgi:ABC-type nickel/cobalt efflux system permease component RcnA